tara:strand:+ start:1593 stop:2459 length:867 start_codon:yes stop_codon:yes gene_type:complete
MTTETTQFKERKISTFDNLSLYVKDYGNPLSSLTPILCLSGLTRTSMDFEKFAELHSGNGRRIICPDYRGRGLSQYDPQWRNYNPQVYLQDIQDILAALNIHNIIIVGTSLGGLLGMGMAVTTPSSMTGLIINDIGPEIEVGGLKNIIDYIKVDRCYADLQSAFVAITTSFPNLKFQNEKMLFEVVKNTFRECENGTFRFNWDVKIVKELLQKNYVIPDLWTLFRSLNKIPTLCIRGSCSDMLSVRCFHQMKFEKSDLHTVEVPDTGHAPTLTEPEAIEALDSFIARF